MSEHLFETSLAVAEDTPADRKWSVGVFSAGGHAPEVCLRHCLNGSTALAGSHGCAMVRWLARRGRDPLAAGKDAGHLELPQFCDRGYAVSLLESEGSGHPDVLILRPPAAAYSADEPDPAAIAAVQELTVHNRRLNQEVNGLADEVLRSYEQINLIFDVSAQIAILSDADEVRRMLLSKLRHLFDADTVYYASPADRRAKEVQRDGRMRRGWMRAAASPGSPVSGEEVRVEDPELIELPAEFADVLSSLRRSQRVIVSSDDVRHQRTGYGTSMWGPLKDGDGSWAVVGIIRRSVQFVAGDMLLLDSALTYGGHILSNLRLVEQLKRTSFEAVRALVNAIDQKDSYTCGHSERVGFLAKVTGQFMGLPAATLQELEWAGLLHDVGKIGIPERVLNKPGKLTSEELALIKEHPARSFEVLRPVQSLEPVLQAVLYHHENPDGSGYPEGLKGEEIPLMARIIHVVDVFDALTSSRSYRSAFGVERAIEMLKQDAGEKLDAHIVDQFLGAWAILPMTYPEQYNRWFGREAHK